MTDVHVTPYLGVPPEAFVAWRETARSVADELAATALERDRANRHPSAEIDLLRRRGLLGFATPVELGGAGGSLPQALVLGRIVSTGDGSIGQLLTYHWSNGLWTHILGTPEQRTAVARGVGEHGWFQASVSNPRDHDFDVEADGKGYRLTGRRTFATGVALADTIAVGFLDGDRRRWAQIPHDRAGLSFGGDWDNLGQRLTASGSVTFDDLRVEPDEVLAGLDEGPGDPALRDGLRVQFSQLIFVHLYLGIAEGALSAAARYVREKGRAWPEATVDEATEDPYHQQLLGRYSANLAAGVALADEAALQHARALDRGAELDATEYGELALQVDQAKSVATEVSLETTSGIYQATGARSTSNAEGLDIYWRNVRTHTTHDPLPYRQREIGVHLLTGRLPLPRDLGALDARPRPSGGGEER